MFEWLRERRKNRRDAAALAHYADWLRPKGGNSEEWVRSTAGQPVLRTDRFASDAIVPIVATTYLLGSSKREPTDSTVLLVVALERRGRAPDGSSSVALIEIARSVVDFPTGQDVSDVSVLTFLDAFLHQRREFQFAWISPSMRARFYDDKALLSRYEYSIAQALQSLPAALEAIVGEPPSPAIVDSVRRQHMIDGYNQRLTAVFESASLRTDREISPFFLMAFVVAPPADIRRYAEIRRAMLRAAPTDALAVLEARGGAGYDSEVAAQATLNDADFEDRQLFYERNVTRAIAARASLESGDPRPHQDEFAAAWGALIEGLERSEVELINAHIKRSPGNDYMVRMASTLFWDRMTRIDPSHAKTVHLGLTFGIRDALPSHRTATEGFDGDTFARPQPPRAVTVDPPPSQSDSRSATESSRPGWDDLAKAFDSDVRVLVAALRAGPMGPATARDAIDRFGGLARLTEEMCKGVDSVTRASVRSVAEKFNVTSDSPRSVQEEFLDKASRKVAAANYLIWAELFNNFWRHAELWCKSDPQSFADAIFEQAARAWCSTEAERADFRSCIAKLVRHIRTVEEDPKLDQPASRVGAAFEAQGCKPDDHWIMAVASYWLRAACFHRAALEAAGVVNEQGVVIDR